MMETKKKEVKKKEKAFSYSGRKAKQEAFWVTRWRSGNGLKMTCWAVGNEVSWSTPPTLHRHEASV